MAKKYLSTRGGEKDLSASQAIINGLASDGGLYVPADIRSIEINIETLVNKTYGEIAREIFNAFLDDFTPEQIAHCVDQAYYTGRFENPSPVTVKKVGNRWFLELFHGPTCAFKDMALTILPHLMTTSMRNVGLSDDILILTATSGDTGKAALSGFADVPHIGIMVYYPKDGVSTIQEKQMLTQVGDNTCVVGVRGNFDDTQNGVKKIFGDAEMTAKLAEKNIRLSSANSINIGRLLPQIVYYFYSYAQLVKEQEIALGDTINFVVPTGNFGDILAGYYAKLIGLPVNKLICASNSNRILTDFFESGHYDRNRPFYKTMSPSMDILISSNLERLLYDLADGDTEVVSNWMRCLNQDGRYEIPDEMLREALCLFEGGCSDETETAEAIRKMFEEEHYLMDPHTAVASKVYDDYLKKTEDDRPTVILSTASPFKFGHSVYESIFGAVPDGMNDYEVLDELARKTDTVVPKPLKDLDKMENRHHRVCEIPEMADCVLDFVK